MHFKITYIDYRFFECQIGVLNGRFLGPAEFMESVKELNHIDRFVNIIVLIYLISYITDSTILVKNHRLLVF